MSSILFEYLFNIRAENRVLPAIMDEKTLIFSLGEIFEKNFQTLEEFSENAINNLFFYDIPEGKKMFNIETVRNIISASTLRPYAWQQILVLRHFDTATLEAQNALLKIIEDMPEYMTIFLEAENVGKILPTILSRVANFVNNSSKVTLDETTKHALEKFFSGDQKAWILHLYNTEYSVSEAREILIFSLRNVDYKKQELIENLLTALATTHEKPRNILDAFFLWEDFS